MVTGVALSVAGGLLSPALADRDEALEERADTLASREGGLVHREDGLGGQVQSARGHLEHSSRQLQRATAALQDSRVRLDDARTHLADTLGQLDAAQQVDEQMQRALQAAEARLASAERDLDETRAEIADIEAEIEEFAVQAYASSDPGLMSMDAILNGDSPMEFPEMMSSAESVVSAQTAAMDDHDAARIVMTLHAQRVRDLRNDVAVKRRLAAENLDRKRGLAQQAREARASIQGLVDERAHARARAQQARERDHRILQQMERERERVRDMLQQLQIEQQRLIERQQARLERQEQRRLERQQQRIEERQLAAEQLAAEQLAEEQQLAEQDASGSQQAPSESVPSSDDDGGYLDDPTPGAYITSPYGMRQHPVLDVYKLHDGTDFGASCGTPILAAAAGEVVGSYFNAGYGNRVILGHAPANGVSLATSYNHLESSAVSTGEQVERGEVIGYVGTTGYSTGCHLHFMVYENGQTVDPLGWL